MRVMSRCVKIIVRLHRLFWIYQDHIAALKVGRSTNVIPYENQVKKDSKNQLFSKNRYLFFV